jgi:hypothetical protein
LNKDNLKELLDNYYDERIVYNQLLEFYELKLYDSLSLSKVWTRMKSDTETKLKELDIDIQYLQEEVMK